MTNNKALRHGDVDIIPSQIPTEAKKQKDNVVMHGENGHEHKLFNGQILIHDNTKYIKANEQTYLIHEEHKKIPIPSGEYVVKQEIEFDPYTETLNRVRD